MSKVFSHSLHVAQPSQQSEATHALLEGVPRAALTGAGEVLLEGGVGTVSEHILQLRKEGGGRGEGGGGEGGGGEELHSLYVQ